MVDDGIKRYADRFGLYLKFYHIPTGQTAQFYAFLASFSDGYGSNWNHQDVYGRMDPLSTFLNTRRTVGFSWNIFSECLDDAVDNLKEVSKLIRMHYPVYDTTTETEKNEKEINEQGIYTPGGLDDVYTGDITDPENSFSKINDAGIINAAPLFRVAFSNWISDSSNGNAAGKAQTAGLVGMSSGITFSPNLDMGVFEVDSGTANNNIPMIVPKQIELDFSLTPLHTHPLGWDITGKPRGAFSNFPYGG